VTSLCVVLEGEDLVLFFFFFFNLRMCVEWCMKREKFLCFSVWWSLGGHVCFFSF
jgi:hypothetical protein